MSVYIGFMNVYVFRIMVRNAYQGTNVKIRKKKS